MPETNNEIIKAAIIKNDFFESFPKDLIEKISMSSRLKKISSNQLIFNQGDKAKCFYLILSGQIKLSRLSPGGNEKVIAIMEPNRLFAEATILNNATGYPVNAEVVQDAQIICIDSCAFRQLLLTFPELCLKMIAKLSQKLHFLIGEVDKLTLHNASYRLVSYLLEQAKKSDGSVQLSVPKHVIASRISVKPETFSRILKQLSKDGLVEIKKNNIKLKDINLLKSYIEISLD